MAGSPQVTKSSGAGMGRAEESQINHSRLVVRGSNWSRVKAQHIQIIQELSPASSEVERSAFNRVVVGSIPTPGVAFSFTVGGSAPFLSSFKY